MAIYNQLQDPQQDVGWGAVAGSSGGVVLDATTGTLGTAIGGHAILQALGVPPSRTMASNKQGMSPAIRSLYKRVSANVRLVSPVGT